MAKVTQIDYQNALYDIEDADAQSKISDLQTAVANTYTKAQVDTKLDNYYDKHQVDAITPRGISGQYATNVTLKDFSASPVQFTPGNDGVLFLVLQNRNASNASSIAFVLNGYTIFNPYVTANTLIALTVPLKKNDILRIEVRTGTSNDIASNGRFNPYT